MYQPIISLNTPSNDPLIKRARHLGFKYVTDLEALRALQLNSTVTDRVDRILAIEKLKVDATAITTTLPEVDHVIKGLCVGTITEFVGLPGMGKTELCYKIAVKYLMNADVGNVVYITTNGTYSAERCGEIVRMFCGNNESTIRSLLKRIKVFDTVDIDELLATINQLIISVNYTIGLLIVDGIFVHLKSVEQMPWIRVISKLLGDIKKCAVDHQCPIVFTNSLTTNIVDGKTQLVSYLGEYYLQYINARILLTKDDDDDDGKIVAQVEKPPPTKRNDSVIANKFS